MFDGWFPSQNSILMFIGLIFIVGIIIGGGVAVFLFHLF